MNKEAEETAESDGLDDVQFQQLLQEIPSLMALKRAAGLFDRVRWFSRLGERFDGETEAVGRAYLDTLGFPEADIVPVGDWEDAIAVSETHDWGSSFWEAEEQLRAALAADALTRLEESALQVGLSHIASVVGDSARESLDDVAAMWDIDDETLINLAVGSAVQTCHMAALVIVAGEEADHPFALKYRLFELGRWPISLTGASFNLF